MKKLFLLFNCVLFTTLVYGQNFWFGPKMGFDINFQRWNNTEQNSLVTPYLDLFIESYSEESNSSLYAQLGYHTRGSAIRFNFWNAQSGFDYRFNNLVLGVGAKKVFKEDSKYKPYYLLGVRGEYTVSTNLDKYETSTLALIHPLNEYVNKINYGVSFGAGMSIPFNDAIGGFAELSIHPDLSYQYQQPTIPNIQVPDSPFRTMETTTLPEREIRNVTLELTIGIRFLRKVEYY